MRTSRLTPKLVLALRPVGGNVGLTTPPLNSYSVPDTVWDPGFVRFVVSVTPVKRERVFEPGTVMQLIGEFCFRSADAAMALIVSPSSEGYSHTTPPPPHGRDNPGSLEIRWDRLCRPKNFASRGPVVRRLTVWVGYWVAACEYLDSDMLQLQWNMHVVSLLGRKATNDHRWWCRWVVSLHGHRVVICGGIFDM
jgi:hypothetical protein